MATALSFTQTQSQHQRMSTAQTQSLKVLQTPYAELRTQLETLLCENPFLEYAPETRVQEASTGPESDWERTPFDAALDNQGTGLEGGEAYESAQGQTQTLSAYLRGQLAFLRLSQEERGALEDAIDSLDEEGYLRDEPWQDAALQPVWRQKERSEMQAGFEVQSQNDTRTENLEAQTAQQRRTIALLQSLEPAGVGARDLSECLVLQLQRLLQHHREWDQGEKKHVHSLAMRLCQFELKALAQRRWQVLAADLNTDVASLEAALGLIKTLHPKPGQAFATIRPVVRIAELEVYAATRPPHWRVRSLNPLRLRMQETRLAQWRLKEQVGEARWWCRALLQRETTLLAIGQAIAELQADFFTRGPTGLKPMGLSHIAAHIGMHESTVSRAMEEKYLQCSRGIFALRYFLSSGLALRTNAGHEESAMSSHQVRARIQKMLEAENPHKPLSDQKIADKLAKEGIQCARRTVAKYREAMGVLPANLRKSIQT